MFAIAILAILIAIGVPAMGVFIEKNRLKGAAEAVFNDLNYARSEAIKQNRELSLSITTDGTSWCYGIDEEPGCECLPEAETQCALKIVIGNLSHDAASYPGIKLTTNFSGTPPHVTFKPTRGTPNGAGRFEIKASNKGQLDVIVSPLGRIRICAPKNSVKIAGYPNC